MASFQRFSNRANSVVCTQIFLRLSMLLAIALLLLPPATHARQGGLPADEPSEPTLESENIVDWADVLRSLQVDTPTPRIPLASDSLLIAPAPSENRELTPSILPVTKPLLKSDRQSFSWWDASLQTTFFIGTEHVWRLQEAKTRSGLRGPFWRDYFKSVSRLGGWADGDSFVTNYFAHPASGAVMGFIFIQNYPNGRYLEFNSGRHYWMTRLQAMAWAAAWSTEFEIGPWSESSFGNVGLVRHSQAWVDLVMTPTLGFAVMLEQDIVERYVVSFVEERTTSHFNRAAARSFLNPTRSFANLFRFRAPWYRDDRTIDNVSRIPEWAR